MNTTETLEELYFKAQKAYEAIPKQPFARTIDEEKQRITISCPNCGIVYGDIPVGWSHICFNTPIFCCGKMMI